MEAMFCLGYTVFFLNIKIIIKKNDKFNGNITFFVKQ